MSGFTNHEETIAAIVTATTVILGGMYKLGKAGTKVVRAIDDIRDDLRIFRGTPADPKDGTPAVPGVMKLIGGLGEGQIEILHRLDVQDRTLATQGTQLQEVRSQVYPNGGKSMADKVQSTLNAVTA